MARNSRGDNSRTWRVSSIENSHVLGREHWKKLTSPVLFERLVARAHELLGDRFWGNGAIPDGITPVDLALDAIEDVLLGVAGWDSERDPDPYFRLADIVNSKVSNLVWSYRNRRAKFLARELDEPVREATEFDAIYQEASDESFLQSLLEAARGNPDLGAYLIAASKFDKRRDIAGYLGVTVSEVTNLQKRARRLVARKAPECSNNLPAGSGI